VEAGGERVKVVILAGGFGNFGHGALLVRYPDGSLLACAEAWGIRRVGSAGVQKPSWNKEL